jgi:SynChlorMet cassette protein ScmD
MKDADRPTVNPVVVLREESDDWAILFNPDTSDAVGINPVGVETWRLLDGKRTAGELGGCLKDRFENVPESASAEILEFLGDLEKLGFLAAGPGAKAG